MPRSMWKGAITFGMVTIPVKLYNGTEAKDISFRQVHEDDGGRIRYKRVCEVCGEEIEYADIAKGYEASDGRMAVLTKSDLDELPLPTAKSVDVLAFVDSDQIDPVYFDRTYVLEADGPGAKPYVLLRDAMISSGRDAVVKIAIRTRESLALIRVRDEVLVLQTMLWPDEVRDVSFAAPPEEVTATKAEVKMAEQFIEALASEWEPENYTDSYREAVEELVEAKLDGVELPSGEAPAESEVVDLVAALRASVEAAKQRRAEEAEAAKKSTKKAAS
ncbi:Ku protein [Enemella sp. A6]|uniref:non-homologous end joining protein Ku n=1 Tax=Enemella sp. A6 TaxID=3440152 RepID=UPI003EB97A42